ncbi:thiamine pyrophosphate-dependent enzyme [Micromonospora echinospora]|uniref:thiamine pyrophosphate-dependent enzyme n=1 Tax=Micromonospora echinospora TaxID=1877 RepID=UPI0033ED845D
MMSKTEAVKVVLAAAGTLPVVFTTGFASRMAQTLGPRPQNLYVVGSMGLAAAIGAGLASTGGGPVIVADGDGSLLMNASVLCTLGGMPTLPLAHVVLDDRRYASTGGQPTHSGRHDLVGMARSAGYPVTGTTSDPAELAERLAGWVDDAYPLTFVHCRLLGHDEPPGPRIAEDLRAHGATFRRALSERRGS